MRRGLEEVSQVQMNLYQARNDNEVGDVDDPVMAVGLDVLRHVGDPALGERDV
jgi:hypothetical protein